MSEINQNDDPSMDDEDDVMFGETALTTDKPRPAHARFLKPAPDATDPLWISKVKLNTRNVRVQAALADSYIMHCLVQGEVFPEKRGRMLHRVQQGRNEVLLYVVSPNEPDWTPFRRIAITAEKKAWTPKFTKDSLLRFQITASPSVQIGVKDRNNKTLHFYEQNDQEEWLRVRFFDRGAEVVEVTAGRWSRLVCDKPGANVYELAVPFSGVLRVKDPVMLAHATRYGVGRGKAFGLGMLTLARAQ